MNSESNKLASAKCLMYTHYRLFISLHSWLCPCVTLLQCQSSVGLGGWTATARQTRETLSLYISWWKPSLVKSVKTQSASRPRRPEGYLQLTPETPTWREQPNTTCCLATGLMMKNHHPGFFLISSYDIAFGFACINEKQKSKQCEDYQVILTCPSDFCQGTFSCRRDSTRTPCYYLYACIKWWKDPKLKMLFQCCTGCRTRWFDVDTPKERGDYETLLQLQMLYPSEVCTRPVAIEAMTLSGVPAHETGDVFQVWVVEVLITQTCPVD